MRHIPTDRRERKHVLTGHNEMKYVPTGHNEMKHVSVGRKERKHVPVGRRERKYVPTGHNEMKHVSVGRKERKHVPVGAQGKGETMKRKKTEGVVKRKGFFKKSTAGILTCALCITSVFSGITPMTADAAGTTPRFKDISKHWGEAAITHAADMGMVKGNNNGKYNPDANLTRAELVSIINNIFGATEKADLSEFSDVDPKKWYYENLQIAYFMETIWGKVGGKLGPDDPITREDAIVGIARAFELSSDNTSALNKFSDGTKVSDDAKKNVSAMVSAGYINGFPVKGAKTPTYTIKPNSYLTRAEIAAIITNMISEIYIPGKSYSGRIIGGCMVINEENTHINGVTVNGDLVIGDGVGEAGTIIENSTIKGRLIVRGGGEYSVYLSDTVVEGGTVVNSPSVGVRLVGEGNASAGIVTAKTSVILDGNGFTSLQVPNSAKEGSTFNIWNTTLDSVDINVPRTAVNVASGADVANIRFNGKAGHSVLSMSKNSSLEFLGVSAINVSVTGTGSIWEAQINAGGFSCDFTPKKYNIANNISATISGKSRSGGDYTSPDQNEYLRNTESRNISAIVDSNALDSYDDFKVTMVASSTANVAYLTPKGSVQVPFRLGDINTSSSSSNNYFNERYAYWIEVEVPAPSGYSSTAEVRHNIDGQIKSYSYNVRHGSLQIFVPVTKSASESNGSISQRFYIDWGNNKEVLDIRGSNIQVKELTREEQSMLIDQFREAIFTGCDGTNYIGSEAIRRLILTDNPLGLDLRGYLSYDESDQNYLAVKVYENRHSLTSKAQIQKLLVLETSRKGALYLVNNASKGEELRDILDDEIYSAELSVDTSEGSKYASLSGRGKVALGNAIITARKDEFADAAAFKAAYDKALEAVLKTETTLLKALNDAVNSAALQKVYETAANATYLGLATGSAPYTQFPASQKSSIAASAYAALPFADLDEARSILVTLIGVDIDPSLEPVNISSISMDASTATIVLGQGYAAGASIKLSSGETVPVSANNATWAVDKLSIADVDSTGVIEGVGVGSAKVSVISKDDNKKTASMTVKVIAPVPATGISLNKSETMIGVGRYENLIATLSPATTTDLVEWGSEDNSIAMVDNKGRVYGMGRGVTNVYAMIDSSTISTCKVIVLSEDKDILLDIDEATIGVGTEVQVKAYVGPVTTPNKGVYWTSNNTGVATVDATGHIRGTGEGTTEIVAESMAFSGVKAVCYITVDDRNGVILDKKEIDMFPNGIDRLMASVVPNGGEVLWRSDDEKIATVAAEPGVTGSAVITAIKPGTVRISATSAEDSKAMASCLVTVSSTKLTLKLSTTKYTITNDPDEQIILSPVFSPIPSNSKIIWTVPIGSTVVSVDDNGVVRPKLGGTATIIGVPEADKSISVTCTVTVVDIAVTSITATPAFTIILNDRVNIPYNIQPQNATNKEVDWYAVDPSTLTVYKGAYPYATDADKPKIEGIKPTRTTQEVVIEATYKKDPDNPTSGAMVVDVPTKTSIETVDNPVKLIGTTANGKTTEIMVTVLPQSGRGEVQNISIDLDNWVYKVGETQSLTVRFNLDENGNPSPNQPSNQKLSWTSDNSSVATVEPGTGAFKAISPGIATISARSDDGAKTDSKTIVVAPGALTNISFQYDTQSAEYPGRFISAEIGGTVKNVNASVNSDATDKSLYYVIEKADANGNTIAGDAPISIDANGAITVNSLGVAKITATPQQRIAYGSARPGDSNVIADKGPNNMYPINSQITSVGGVYYGPNKANSLTSSGLMVLDPNTPIPLVIKNPAAPVTFYVWAKPIPLTNMVLANNTNPTIPIGSTPVTVYMPKSTTAPASDEKMTIRANLTPATATVDESSVKWEITGAGAENVTVSGVRFERTKNAAGEVTALYVLADVIGGTTTGAVNVKFSVSSMQGNGLSPISGGQQQQVQAVTMTGNFNLQINPRPATSFTLSPPVSTASTTGAWYIGDSVDLTTRAGVVTINPANASINNIYANVKDRITNWSSSNPTAISVDQNGVLTFKATGSAVITAKLKSVTNENNSLANASMTITCAGINPAAAGGGIVATGGTVAAGANTAQFSSQYVMPVSNQTAINTSLENVPSDLYDTGLIMAMSGTDATSEQKDSTGAVKASSQAQKKARAVKPLTKGSKNSNVAVSTISARLTANVVKGQIMQLMPIVTPVIADLSKITWTSSDPKIATVDENGIVTGITAGKYVRITAKAANGRSAVTTVTVINPPTNPLTGIKMSKTSLAMGVSDITALSVSYTPTKAPVKGLTWYSSNMAVASVDQSGRVTAIGNGEAIITAVSDEGGMTANCKVTVSVKISSIKISKSVLRLSVGSSEWLSYTIAPAGASDAVVTWKSGNTSVATVSSTGQITAHKTGQSYITVSAGGKTSTCLVTVVK